MQVFEASADHGITMMNWCQPSPASLLQLEHFRVQQDKWCGRTLLPFISVKQDFQKDLLYLTPSESFLFLQHLNITGESTNPHQILNWWTSAVGGGGLIYIRNA